MIDRFASRIVRLVSGHVVAAKQAEFDELLGSPLEWVAVRPPLVTDGPYTGRYRTGVDVLRPGLRFRRWRVLRLADGADVRGDRGDDEHQE